MNPRTLNHSLACTLILALTTSALPAQIRPAPAKSTAKSPTKLAPNFTLPDLTGKPIQLNSYRGKLVLLNFWATWCGPCLAEIPRFSAWQQKYAAHGLQVIGVSMDDEAAPVQKVYRKLQLTYPVVIGDEHLGNLYGGVLGLPITYLIDPQGHILARYQGEPNLSQLEATIQKNLPTP